ncbi:unnamed protein product, partial [Didymodactylos carnosus]
TSSTENLLIGYCLMFNTYSTWEGKALWLEDLYVKPEYRKKGIGQMFFKVTVQIAIDTECARLQFSVLNWNIDAINFYEARGVVDMTKKEQWHVFRMTREKMKFYLE